ncbi:ABC transporter permease [Acidihalobacter aeolianus]|uniref:Transport permease protein n=1 Tax=Acidihalobacter aeolianus TaxID=2792603 RepID=A0A1D8K7M7_9GAMM|nr:ABC transporter permease [Acidihalobacter aeolianus]AOV16967.1 ABC transporter permease [Acidihalobacter aeolianus]
MELRSQYIALQTIVVKEILRFSRIWVQTIVPPAVTTSLYFVIFGQLIGHRIGHMEGYSYIQYIVPGLIMMSIITSSYSNVVSSFFGAKFGHYVEELLVSPIPNYLILLGYVLGGVSRGMAVGLGVTLISLAFTHLHVENLAVTLSIAVLTSMLFSLAGFINAVFARNFDDISIVPTFVLTPLTYLGGVFYSINLLPSFWQKASLANPVLYMVNGFRDGILGSSDVPLWVSYSVIVGFIAVLATLALNLLYRGVGIRN